MLTLAKKQNIIIATNASLTCLTSASVLICTLTSVYVSIKQAQINCKKQLTGKALEIIIVTVRKQTDTKTKTNNNKKQLTGKALEIIIVTVRK